MVISEVKYFCDICGEPIEAPNVKGITTISSEGYYDDFKLVLGEDSQIVITDVCPKCMKAIDDTLLNIYKEKHPE